MLQRMVVADRWILQGVQTVFAVFVRAAKNIGHVLQHAIIAVGATHVAAYQPFAPFDQPTASHSASEIDEANDHGRAGSDRCPN